MARIGIYVEPVGTGIGGAETTVAILAEALARNHKVDLLHRIPALSAEYLGTSAGADLSNVAVRYVEVKSNSTQSSARNPIAHYKASRALHAGLSEGYDMFIAVVHQIPPFCHAAKGALIVLFPQPPAPYVNMAGGFELKSALRRPARYLYQRWLWKKRMETYRVKTSISDYARVWARRYWHIDCPVLYPPVDTCFEKVEKENIILSVGRFAMEGEGHTKKQPEMLATFRQMENEGLRNWEYFSVGGLRDSPNHHLFFNELCDSYAGSSVHLISNIERDRLRNLYQRASIFWHAAGYGDDEALPVFAEHFGITTVEAMAAGCVPVVINKGGQREIVQHGVNGFLWDTLEELKEYTRTLINDAPLRARMSEAARTSARLYSRETFVETFLGLLELTPVRGKSLPQSQLN